MVILMTGASFWTVVPPIEKVPAGISLRTMLLGRVAPVSSGKVGALSSLQEMTNNNVQNEITKRFEFLID